MDHRARCDRQAHLTRRGLLQASLRTSLGAWLGAGLGAGWARAQEGRAARADALVLLWMNGGMTQTDTFDPKPGTRSAGPLGAIRTAAPGVELSELLPRLAGEMRDVALIRSMATREGAHERARHLLHTGWAPNPTVAYPDLGALISEQQGDPKAELPAYVCVGSGGEGPGFLGAPHAPLTVADASRPIENLRYPEGVDAARFDRRRRLLEAVERKFRRDHPGAAAQGHTDAYARADRLMHSPRVEAFDLAREPQRVRDAYGEHAFGRGCLLARRLVEAGVKVVEVELGGWDTHQDNFTRVRTLAGQLDQGFAALVADLRGRQRLARTLVVCLTEFGRTPGINQQEGRDHFANGWSAALAGGPVRGGAVVGATSEDGLRVAARPVSAPELVATVLVALGADPARELVTPEGRPIRAVDAAAAPVAELLR